MPNEGVIQFNVEHSQQKIPAYLQTQAFELLAWRRLIFLLGGIGQDDNRYEGCGFGNISLRTTAPQYDFPSSFLITGTQTGCKEQLESSDLAWVKKTFIDLEKVKSCGECLPSSESMTHGALYEISTDIQAILHVHLPQVFSLRKKLQLLSTSEKATYGTVAMVREVQRLQQQSSSNSKRLLAQKAFTMEGHEDGLVIFGASMHEATSLLLLIMANAELLQKMNLSTVHD